MADWSKIQNLVDGGVINAVSAANSQQGLWYWREAVRRCVQDFRETGTPAVYTLQAAPTSGNIALATTAPTARLFGCVMDNTSSSIFYLQISDLTTASFTLGSTAPYAVIRAPANTCSAVVFAIPIMANATNGGLAAGVTTTFSGGTQTSASGVLVGFVYST